MDGAQVERYQLRNVCYVMCGLHMWADAVMLIWDGGETLACRLCSECLSKGDLYICLVFGSNVHNACVLHVRFCICSAQLSLTYKIAIEMK